MTRAFKAMLSIRAKYAAVEIGVLVFLYALTLASEVLLFSARISDETFRVWFVQGMQGLVIAVLVPLLTYWGAKESRSIGMQFGASRATIAKTEFIFGLVCVAVLTAAVVAGIVGVRMFAAQHGCIAVDSMRGVHSETPIATTLAFDYIFGEVIAFASFVCLGKVLAICASLSLECLKTIVAGVVCLVLITSLGILPYLDFRSMLLFNTVLLLKVAIVLIMFLVYCRELIRMKA